MPPVSDIAEDLVLEGEELQREGPCIEEGVGRVVVPSRGKLFADDGTVNVAVIRPCVSRGKRLQGLPPIYEPTMLGRNAGVFEDWHMWMGHMSVPLREALEELEESLEQLQEAAAGRRLFSELGGRVVKTWYDPDFRSKEDDTNGYRPGAVMGKVIPYPASKQILEADPDGLHVSIAAWPTSARSANPSWDPGIKGMAIEGFRTRPRGSVDWVLRGGAGGRPVSNQLTEAEAAAVSALGSFYSLPRPAPTRRKETMSGIDLKSADAKQLREQLLADNPALAEELGIKAPAPTPGPVAESATSGVMTVAEVEALVERKLAEQRTTLTQEFTAKLGEAESDVETAVEEALQEARLAETNEKLAHRLIKASGLPARWQEDLLRSFSVSPAGVPAALLTESEVDEKGETISAQDVLKNRVTESIQHARDLIADAGGRPRVTDLGGAAPRKVAAPKHSAFRDFLVESGDDLGEKPEETIKNIVQEGIV